MRTSLTALSCLLALLAAAPVARADDIPEWSVEDFAPGEKDAPEGWSPAGEATALPENTPDEAMILEIGSGCDLGEDELYVEFRSYKNKDGAIAALALVDIDAEPGKFMELLNAKATECGWHVRDFGDPHRIMITSGREGIPEKIAAWQFDAAFYRLIDRATKPLTSWPPRDQMGLQRIQRGMRHAALADRFSKGSGAVEAIKGHAAMLQQQNDAAIEAFRKALKPDAKMPPKGALRVIAAGQLVQLLLIREANQKSQADVEESLAVGKKAIEWESENPSNFMKFGNRYNVACAYARLGKLDEAFAELMRSFELAKELMSETEYKQHWIHCEEKDPDMDSLRTEPRWKAFVDKFKPDDLKKKDAEKPAEEPDKPAGDGE